MYTFENMEDTAVDADGVNENFSSALNTRDDDENKADTVLESADTEIPYIPNVAHQDHMKTYISYSLPCLLCREQFNNQNNLAIHMASHVTAGPTEVSTQTVASIDNILSSAGSRFKLLQEFFERLPPFQPDTQENIQVETVADMKFHGKYAETKDSKECKIYADDENTNPVGVIVIKPQEPCENFIKTE